MKKFIISISLIGSLFAGGVSAAPFFADPTVCCKRSVEEKISGIWKLINQATIWDGKSRCPTKNTISVPTGLGATGNQQRFKQKIVQDIECPVLIFRPDGNSSVKPKPPSSPGIFTGNVLEQFKNWFLGNNK